MNTNVIAAIVIVAIVLAAFMKAAKRKRETATDTYEYKASQSLCTPAELRFLRCLDASINPTHRVFAKVRLADIIQPRTGQFAARSKVVQKHLDFVICDRETTKPIYAIELNDKSHNRSDRKERDQFVMEAMRSAGVPLLFHKAAARYDVESIRAEIHRLLQPIAG